MKKLFFTLLITLIHLSFSAQFVATVEMKEHVEGICNEKEVYALFPMLKGQEEAVCPTTDDEILQRLNAEVKFLQENPKYKDKGMIGLMINCEGKVVQCQMDNKTKSKELDQQIEEVFASLGEWKPGKLSGKEVDSMILYSFSIKKGVVSFD